MFVMILLSLHIKSNTSINRLPLRVYVDVAFQFYIVQPKLKSLCMSIYSNYLKPGPCVSK